MVPRAVVIGAGWAGEGHTIALRDAGVEVVALCGRTPEPAAAMAAKLAVPQVRFDWHAALEEFRPDIVSIATPAGPHREMAESAAQLGCHVACDKPLATNTTNARAMLEAVEKAGVKHGYAATGCYAPAIIHTQMLIAQGLIGRIYEIESVIHLNLPLLLPYCWLHQLDLGGGLLNNVFTHLLAQVLRATGGVVQAAAGETRTLIERTPVGPTIHDFRDVFPLLGTWAPTQASEWRPVDADLAYTIIVQLRLPQGEIANACFRGSMLGALPQGDYLVFHGEEGSLYVTGNLPGDDHIQCFMRGRGTWEEVPVAPEVAAPSPVQDDSQRAWNQFFREFVADVRGEGYAGYPTFHDGCTAAATIDAARAGRGWTTLSPGTGGAIAAEPAHEGRRALWSNPS
jgi:predicted dehydrogenase